MNRSNLSTRLKKLGTFMRDLKERNFVEFTWATGQGVEATWIGESPGIGGESAEKAHGWVAGDGQIVVTHLGDAVVQGTFSMPFGMSSPRNVEILVSCGLKLLSDDLCLSPSLILWTSCHIL